MEKHQLQCGSSEACPTSEPPHCVRFRTLFGLTEALGSATLVGSVLLPTRTLFVEEGIVTRDFVSAVRMLSSFFA